jgi:adenylate cyclase
VALKANGREHAPQVWLGLVALVFLGAQVRNRQSRRRRYAVWYMKGAVVSAPVGMSVLEVSRMAHLPHQSACGGRGRCTTCRIQVLGTDGALPPPNAVEAEALARMQAPQCMRLACQLRPLVNIRVNPLVPGGSAAHQQHHPHGQELGEEREVTILFVDVRGSTKLAERRLPYDVVFLLSHFFAEMSAAVELAGGHYSNFTGDGLMAIFGLDPAPAPGARSALYCAWDMLERLKLLNERMIEELDEPMAIGIGIHTGEAIVGRMGPPKTPVITALGDTVNTAARLESMTKEFHLPVVVSFSTLEAAGAHAQVEQREVLLRGRSTMLPVAGLDMDTLALCLLAKPESETDTGDLLAPGQAGPHHET